MISGTMEYYANVAADRSVDPLHPPVLVVNAMEEYREESDILGAFVTDCLVRDPNGKIPVAEAYTTYLEWCADVSIKPESRTKFGRNLVAIPGITKTRTMAMRVYSGVKLAS